MKEVKTLTELPKEAKKMEEMANNAYNKLISKYTWETIALQYDNIFNSIMKK